MYVFQRCLQQDAEAAVYHKHDAKAAVYCKKTSAKL